MGLKNIARCFAMALVSIFVLCSCGEAITVGFPKYSLPEKVRMISGGIIAENGRMSLEWDYEQNCVILRDKKNLSVWSTTPYDYYSDKNKEKNFFVENGLRSMLKITYIEPEKNLELEATSYNDVLTQGGYISGRKIKNGIRLIYYFDKIGISISVDFTLENDGLNVSIPVKEIREKENKLYTVSLLPFFSSAKNNSHSYIFVPSGSGALMYTDDVKRSSRLYSNQIYGTDAGQQTIFKNSKNETVRMPVFGVKSEENAILGIVSKGAELASVEANVGDKQYGYSAAYAKFCVRGKSSTLVKDAANKNAEVTKYSEPISQNEFTVKYVVLDNDNADYNGMAVAYRNWLNQKYKLEKVKDAAPVVIDFLGGEQTKKFLFGIPRISTDVVTTFNNVKEILSDFTERTGVKPTIRLRGFGDSGLDYGELANNFKVSGIYGGKKGLKSLKSYCDKNNIEMYLDFDTVFYSKSGGGYSVRKAATTANTVRAKYYSYDLVTHKQDSYKPSAYLLGREDLSRIDSRLIKSVDSLGVDAVGLSTLSNTAYSDYRNKAYYYKSNMAKDVANLYKKLKEKDIAIMSDSANDYAAALSDCVFNAPSGSSKLFIFDEEIPFYQMVFHGTTGIASGSINLAANPIKEYLSAISVGSKLSFTCISDINEGYISGNHGELSYSVYDDIKDQIANYAKQSQEVISKVSNAKIVSFKRIGNVSETVFDNGVIVCVNFGKESAETSIGSVAAESFAYKDK